MRVLIGAWTVKGGCPCCAPCHCVDSCSVSIPVHRSVLPGDFPALESVAKMAVKEKQKFERLEIKKEDLLKMFDVSVLTQ